MSYFIGFAYEREILYMKKLFIYLFFLFSFGMFCSSDSVVSCEGSFDWEKLIFGDRVTEAGTSLNTAFLEKMERLTGDRRNNIEAIYSILTFDFNMDLDTVTPQFINNSRRGAADVFADLSENFRNQPLTYELRIRQAEKAINDFIELLSQTKQEIGD